MHKIDASGLSCPEPIYLLKKAIKSSDEILLIVDNKTSVETCTRFAKANKFNVSVNSVGSVHELTIKK